MKRRSTLPEVVVRKDESAPTSLAREGRITAWAGPHAVVVELAGGQLVTAQLPPAPHRGVAVVVSFDGPEPRVSQYHAARETVRVERAPEEVP